MEPIALLSVAVISSGVSQAACPGPADRDYRFLRVEPRVLGKLREALTFKEGDSISFAGDDASVDDFGFRTPTSESARCHPRAHRTWFVVMNGRVIVYVGIEERGAPTMRLRAEQRGQARLAADIVEAGDEFSKAFMLAIERGDSAEKIDPRDTLFLPIPRRVPFRNASSSMRSATCRSCVSCCGAHPTPHSERWRRRFSATPLTSRPSWTISCTR